MKESVETIRRGSLRSSLWEQPIREGEEARVRLPPIQGGPHMAADGGSSSRRSSRDGAGQGTGSRRSSSITFSGPVPMGRRGSQARRNSIRVPQTLLARPADAEPAEQLSSLVPLPQIPRFTSTMSLEAQYSIMKGYEDRLWRQLSSVYPDYTGLLHRSQTPRNGRVLLRDAGQEPPDDEALPEEDASVGEDLVDGGHTTRSLPPPSLYRGVGVEMPKSARNPRAAGLSVPHHRQLALSRRLLMAQSLLDSLADSSCAITSQPACRPSKQSFNVIQGYNVWANGWQEEFQIN